MFKFLGLFAVSVTVALGCVPLGDGGSGGNDDDGEILDYAITSTPTFELAYSPPIEWTYPASGDPAMYQEKNQALAQKVAQEMIELAFLKAFSKAAVLGPKGIDYGLSDFEGYKINVVANENDAQNDDGIVQGGTVRYTCVRITEPEPKPTLEGGVEPSPDPLGACDSLKPLIQEPSFKIKSGPTLTGRQWKDVASGLEKALKEFNVDIKSIIVSA